ncbi:MAG: hypothetical protein ABIV39_07890, partial [Verrucomicrobiota bacterium]
VGVAIKTIALQNLQKMVGRTSIPCQTLQSFSNELNHYYANKPGLSNVIKVEYQLEKKTVADWTSGKVLAISNRVAKPFAGSFMMPVFNSDQTGKIFASRRAPPIGVHFTPL